MLQYFTFDQTKAILGGRLAMHENGECWIYTGPISLEGYGVHQSKHAHRVVLSRMMGGTIPKGILSLHSCEVRSCSRPDHIRPGTHAENMVDKVNSPKWAATRARISDALKGVRRNNVENYTRGAMARASDAACRANMSAAAKAKWAPLKKVSTVCFQIEANTGSAFVDAGFRPMDTIEEARGFLRSLPELNKFRIVQVTTIRKAVK